MEATKILGVKVNNATKEEALEFIKRGLIKGGKKIKIFTPNPEIIAFAGNNKRFKTILNTSDLALPDGMGVIWAGKLLGRNFKERIAGADFMEMLCQTAEKQGLTVGLMGGGAKIAERTAECLLRKYPKLKIVFTSSEWALKGAAIDILFVAFGFPKQEQWIYENLPKIPVKAAMAVGGSFDYISGAVPRAPLFIRKVGLEWLFRLIIQPWRIRRQLALLQFIFLVFKERFDIGDKT